MEGEGAQVGEKGEGGEGGIHTADSQSLSHTPGHMRRWAMSKRMLTDQPHLQLPPPAPTAPLALLRLPFAVKNVWRQLYFYVHITHTHTYTHRHTLAHTHTNTYAIHFILSHIFMYEIFISIHLKYVCNSLSLPPPSPCVFRSASSFRLLCFDFQLLNATSAYNTPLRPLSHPQPLTSQLRKWGLSGQCRRGCYNRDEKERTAGWKPAWRMRGGWNGWLGEQWTPLFPPPSLCFGCPRNFFNN